MGVMVVLNKYIFSETKDSHDVVMFSILCYSLRSTQLVVSAPTQDKLVLIEFYLVLQSFDTHALNAYIVCT